MGRFLGRLLHETSNIQVNDGDKPLSFWRDTLVIEDASYIKTSVGTVGQFIDTIIAGK